MSSLLPVPPASDTVERAILDELDECLAALSDDAQASAKRVHSTRKHIKRTRALLALLGHERRFESFDARLRLLGRVLGVVRDAAAQAVTWSEGAERFSAPIRSVIDRHLRERQARQASPERQLRRLTRTGRVLLAVRQQLAATFAAAEACREKRVRRAARASYRKARRALHSASEHPTADRVHALRRAAKRHQHQVQFLEQSWSRPLKARRKRLEKLTELLGLHHDVSAIEAELAERCSAELDGQDATWRQAFRDWQQELFEGALELAEPAFSERPRAFQECLD